MVSEAIDPQDPTPQPASVHTAAANAAVAKRLPFSDRTDFDRASRGLLAQIDPPHVIGAGERMVWDNNRYDFLNGDAPAEVNPSLWRQAQLNNHHGLFEVCDGIYQVRGYDLSNITFVRTDTGWIVIDPLTAAETAAAARNLVDQHFGFRPIMAIIYTHSHVDHFGGVRGIVTDAEVARGEVRIIAPAGFLEAAVSENVVAGPVMRRRAMYMYGMLLPPGSRGHVDAGLGKATPIGSVGLIAPTESIDNTGDEKVIDGVKIEFQMTPGSEAPAEMNFYFPQFGALCMAENCSATLHNVYTPRGAEIRDALSWSRYINEAFERYIDIADVAFASHHWPRWGKADIESWLTGQRDVYRYIHDETMRLANHGCKPLEIAEQLEVPAALGDEFFNRDYYGTVNHNVKAVYQRYLGWFDGNPAHLHPLPEVEASKRMVEYMGGADAVLQRAAADFANGDYRWVAQVVNHVVFADPTNTEARRLQAATLEQLGYQSESTPWRDFYLTGAQELRNGTPAMPGMRPSASPDVLKAMTPEMLLDLCAMKLNGPAATHVSMTFDLTFSDITRDAATRARGGLRRRVTVANGVLVAGTRAIGGADATITTTTETFAKLVNALSTVADELAAARLSIDGDQATFESFLWLLDQFELFFPIIEPHPPR
jgi:alkyl sulfatase BDS1-like metallo-beta-lactamase superfamily hydrolase